MRGKGLWKEATFALRKLDRKKSIEGIEKSKYKGPEAGTSLPV